MKGPKFNAKLTLENQNTDVRLARVIATAEREGLKETDLRLMKNVLRPFTHELNYAQGENANPVDINEGLASLVASMFVEMMSRIVQPGACGNAAMVATFTEDFITDVNRQIVLAVNAQYEAGLVLGEAPPPAGPTH